jgi:hypothetical protein
VLYLGLRVMLHVPVVDSYLCESCEVTPLVETSCLVYSEHIVHAIRSCRIVLIVIR